MTGWVGKTQFGAVWGIPGLILNIPIEEEDFPHVHYTEGTTLLVSFALWTMAMEWFVLGHIVQLLVTVYPKQNGSVEYIHFTLCSYLSM